MIFGSEAPLRALGSILLLASLLHSAAHAEAAAAPAAWNLSQLLGGFRDVKHAQAHYVERRYLSVLKRPIQDTGILVYVAPNFLRKETLEPQHELLLVEGDTLTIERDGRTQTLTHGDYPQIWAFIEGIRATLAGDLLTLEAVYAVNLNGDEASWQLLLQPRDPAMQQIVRSIQIAGSAAQIKRIETVERDGDRTDMVITEDPR